LICFEQCFFDVISRGECDDIKLYPLYQYSSSYDTKQYIFKYFITLETKNARKPKF